MRSVVAVVLDRAASVAAKTAAGHIGVLWLRRKCACGTHAPDGGECESCAKNKLQRKPTTGGRTNAVPGSVHKVLQSPGVPLEKTVRARMESGFGHDFSAVRVHDGGNAARSAADIHAAAYTVGSHVVFGAGRYAPHTSAGRHLLAHELAHVVQQGSTDDSLMRKSLSSLIIDDEDSSAEREADHAADRVAKGEQAAAGSRTATAVQRAPLHSHTPAIEGLDAAGPDADLSGKTEDRLWQCMKGTGGFPQDCPQAPLTWADFRVVRSAGGFGANTGWDVKERPMEPKVAACVRNVLGWSQDQTHVFQATFVPSTSTVLRQFADPTNVAATGCNKPVRECRNHFGQRLPPNRTAGDFTFAGRPSRACPASMVAASVTATSTADCQNIGDECTRTAELESQRLLRHEQGHMNIACAMARKFNLALRHGTPFSVLNTNPVRFIQAIQDKYDRQTQHGCLPSLQASWETEIASGLPKEAIPQVRAPARAPTRRRRRP